MSGESQRDLHDVLHMAGAEVQLGARLVVCAHQVADALVELALEVELAAHALALDLGVGGVEPVGATEHGIADLPGDHRADAAQHLADGLHLLDHAAQKLQVAVQLPDRNGREARHLLPARRDEMEHVHRVRLAVAVDAAVSLLESYRVPRDLVMHHAVTVALQVDALAGGIGADEHPNLGNVGIGLERRLDLGARVVVHTAPDQLDAAVLGQAAGVEQVVEPLLGVDVFCEHDDALIVPSAL